MIPVVISTREGREAWLNGLMESIYQTFTAPIEVLTYHSWEIEAIKSAYLYSDYDEFLFLQDSCRIKDSRFWYLIDSCSGESVLLMPRPNCYLGIYQREVLDEVFTCGRSDYVIPDSIPWEEQKEWALAYEDWFIRDYIYFATGREVAEGSDLPSIFPEMTDANSPKREMRHGELRMIMENDYFEKAKGTFH